MSKYKSMKDLATRVDTEGGILPVSLGDLRETLGYDRLGVRVLGYIAAGLDGAGLGYFPLSVIEENAVPRKEEVVRVYRKGSALARVVEDVLHPTEAGDDRLRESTGGEALDTLEKVRALVC